jgi:hypothetical protein
MVKEDLQISIVLRIYIRWRRSESSPLNMEKRIH